MGRSEFCRSHGIALSTLNRHLKKQHKKNPIGDEDVSRSRLVAVELAGAPAPVAAASERQGALTVLLSNGRRVEVGSGFDDAMLSRLVTVLERL
jgi:hypothetical protein